MNDLLLRVLMGEQGPRRPLWIMRQAGRYLPEYRKLRESYSFEEMSRTPDLAVDVTLMPLRRFPLDAAIVFADLMSPIASLGTPFKFAPGPVMEKTVRTEAEIDALRNPAPEEIAPEVPEILTKVKKELNGQAVLLGFAGAPWSLASYMVQGQGKAGFPALRAMAMGNPELLGKLLGKLSDLAAKYTIEQHKAGADAIQIFDTWAGLLSVADWRRLVRPHLLSLLERMGQAGIPRILFLQDAPHLVDEYAKLPSEGLALDWRLDIAEVRQKLGFGKVLQGNLDPTTLLAGPEITRQRAKELLERMPARGHIMNLGHGILPEVPVESVQALIDVVHEEKLHAN